MVRSATEREAEFEKRLAAWRETKARHQDMLRPQIGRPDAAQELEDLCAQEHARSQEVQGAVVQVKEELLREHVDHAKLFVAALSEQCTSILKLTDALVFTDDLGYLPGDELIEKKRKSLKRLQKMQRALGDDDDDGDEGASRKVPHSYQMPDGRHLKQRTWSALDVSELREAFVRHGVRTHAEEQDVSGVAGDTPSDAEVGGDWITQLAEQYNAGPTSLVTTAHRQILRMRDAAWKSFLKHLDDGMAKLKNHFGSLQTEEVQWADEWASLVAALREDSGSQIREK